MKFEKIVQVDYALTQYDAASQQVIELHKIFCELGYSAQIVTPKLDERLKKDCQKENIVIDILQDKKKFIAENKNSLIIYHMRTGRIFNYFLANYPKKIVLYYHNITPAKFYFGNTWKSWLACTLARWQLKQLVQNSFFAWSASEYSANELKKLGMKFSNVMPIVLNPQEYTLTGEKKIYDGRKILMVGRGVPHKRQNEAIEMIAYYLEKISPKIQLWLAGTMKPNFEKFCKNLVHQKKLEDHVEFCGRVSQEELCRLYRSCDLVLSLSEHEGFCVPMIEAMFFDKPILAFNGGAVGEIVGNAGVVLNEKNPKIIAENIEKILTNKTILNNLRIERMKRLKELSRETIREKIKQDLEFLQTEF